MNAETGIMIFLITKKYDAMKQFFIDLGLDVKSEHPGWAQVTPFLNSGRGCMIILPSLLISLEESTDVLPSGPIYIGIDGINEAQISGMRTKYSVKHVKGGFFGGDSYWIEPPDGGVVIATCS